MSDTETFQRRTEGASTAQKVLQYLEFVVVFGVPAGIVLIALPRAGEDLAARQGVIWVANVVMISIVYLGLRLRGQGWAHFGLSFGVPGRDAALRTFFQSLVVCVVTGAVFLLGAVLLSSLFGTPETADMSGYNHLYGNLPLLVASLLGIYIVSSFGEEVVYRGFLITRIEELGKGGRGVRWVAVVISSVVFGLVHYAWGPVGMVQTGLAGLVFAIAYVKVKRNLWVNILAHGYLDTMIIVPLYFTPGSN